MQFFIFFDVSNVFLQSFVQQKQFKLILSQVSAIFSAIFGASFEDFGISLLWITLQAHENIAECSLSFSLELQRNLHSNYSFSL